MTGTDAATGYVVVGDVVDSRQIPDRDQFGGTLADALATVNRTYGESIRADFAAVKGIDEVVGVLDDVRAVYDVVKTVYDAIHPQQVRFVVVRGAIDVNPGGTDATAMDGPAFHDANERMEAVERRDLLFDLDGGDPTVDGLVAGTVNLVLTLREDWTDREFQVVRARERAATQREAAAELGLAQQTVSDALRRAHWKRVHQVERFLDTIFLEYDERTNAT